MITGTDPNTPDSVCAWRSTDILGGLCQLSTCSVCACYLTATIARSLLAVFLKNDLVCSFKYLRMEDFTFPKAQLHTIV